ncbi:hypothetical protein DK058_25280, partial [Salmonella enterica subsp. enterica serovar Typhi]|nr:hypothetical protein [Salmonella enterica subsp. enterica serovar Typhi]
EQGLGRLESKVDANRDHASAGIASAISLGMIRYDDRPGKFSTGVGFGYHDGQAALGVGAGYTSEDQKWRLSAGGSYSPTNTKDSFSAGASATYTWN